MINFRFVKDHSWKDLFSFPPVVITAGGAVGYTYRRYWRSLKHTTHFAAIPKMERGAGTFACARLSGAGQDSGRR